MCVLRVNCSYMGACTRVVSWDLEAAHGLTHWGSFWTLGPLRFFREANDRCASGRAWWRHRCGRCLSFPLAAAGWQGPLADFGAGRPRDGCRVRLPPLPYQVPSLCRLAKLPLVLDRRVPPAFVRLIRRRAQVALVAAAVVAWDACGCRRVRTGLQPGCKGLQAALAAAGVVACGVDAPCLEALEHHGADAVVAAAAQVVCGLGVQALDVALAWRLPRDA